jgi:hypothetical protein
MQVEESTPTTPLKPTRAGFVRGLPLTMPIHEVIERGREAGIELQPSDIHAARYYMRQAAAAESASIPQQLLLGGTFVTKREPGRGKVGTNGAAKGTPAPANGESTAPAAVNGQNGHATASITLTSDESEDTAEENERVTSKRRGRARVQPAAEASGSLHSRLQSRLRQATFRETAREAAVRDEKAMIGKALDGDVKARSKRAAKSVEGVEQELRMIALRIGTQRARELLDEMEALAQRA